MSKTNDTEIENTKLAYTTIQSLLESNEALSDLLVVMSHAMEEDVIKAMTNTGNTSMEKNLSAVRSLGEIAS